MKSSSDLHIAMYPWLAFGHFIPYLHLSNKLAERGHRISFLLPKRVEPKLAKLNRFPNLIHFFPLTIPHGEGLPPGVETLSDIPISLQSHLCTAFDQTRDQVQAILATIMPDFVLFDFAFWVPSIGRELGFKSIRYSIVCAALLSLVIVPCKEMIIGTVKYVEKVRAEFSIKPVADQFGSGVSFYERLHTGAKESDALAIRTCYEIEARFADHIAQHLAKPVLLTGPLLLKKAEAPLDEKCEKWLNKFQPGSVVFCAFGSQNILQKNQFQELLLGFELCGMPFLAALSQPSDCLTMEEAMPDGFEERVQERGLVYGGWVPQEQILNHPSVGCFVSHGGSSSMWEAMASNCQIVLVPPKFDHVVHAMLMVEELKVAVEVKRQENGWISKASLSNAIESAMSADSEVAMAMKRNHARWRKFLLDKDMQETYVDTFVKNLHDLLQKN
ncbi:UDP-glycosyltransferase 79B6-like [Euphorbia lathyris]|uniref:UDP-glycosyltransferase 79B6-like n=1 Tax=Euphorbia lathyris TaxID=212925 RepID=UPI00331355B3